MRYRNLALTGLLCLSTLSAPVLAQTQAGSNIATTKPSQRATLSGSDKSFLDESLVAGLATVEASKLMLTKSSNPKVKEYAQRLIKDVGTLNDELDAIATLKGMTPPTEPGMLQRTQLKALASLDGEEADKMYVQQYGVISQQNSLMGFQNASAKADDAELKAFAKSKVSSFQDRLNLARSLGKSDHGM